MIESPQAAPYGIELREDWLEVGVALMGKRLIDLDEDSLDAAQAELGIRTIRHTVNEALRTATSGRRSRIVAALDVLANAPSDDRDAWR